MKRLLFAAVSLVMVLASCSKDDGNSRMRIKMQDAPTELDAVMVNVQQVRVHRTNNGIDSGWVDLETEAGFYDLLSLQNGVTATLVKEEELTPGKYSQLRLVLGDSNHVVVDSTAYYMDTPSAQSSGLKIKIDQTLEAGKMYDILIDFDAEESIKVKPDSSFKLSPVLKLVTVIEVE